MLQRAFVRGVFALALVLAQGASASAQTATPPTAPDGVSAVLVNLQQALGTSDEPRFRALFAATVPAVRLEQHARDLVRPGVASAVVRERSRDSLVITASHDDDFGDARRGKCFGDRRDEGSAVAREEQSLGEPHPGRIPRSENHPRQHAASYANWWQDKDFGHA